MSVLYSRTSLQFDCGVYQSLLALEGGNIDDYIKQLSQFLIDKAERLNESVDKMETKGWVQIPEGISENVGNFLANNANKTIHSALFVMTNSFLEWALVELCRLVAIYIKEDFKANGQGIEKAKNFLNEKLGLEIDKDKEWELFKDNQKVRNLIVHNASNIIKDYSKGPNQQPDASVFYRNKEHFEYTETGFIFILKMQYIIKSHETAKHYIQKCLKNVIHELTQNKNIKW